MNIRKEREHLRKIQDRVSKKPVWRFFVRLMDNTSQDNIGLIAAGIAFYFLMASFPAIAAAISLYGLFSDTAVITQQMNVLEEFLPRDALQLLTEQAIKIATSDGGALSVGVVLGLLFTIYSTTQGTKALITGFNIAYNEKERRNIIVLTATAYVLTLFLLVFFLMALTLIAVLPAIFAWIPLPGMLDQWILLLRWPIMCALALLAISVLYRFGPCHTKARWKPFSWGAAVATFLWLVMSSLFSFYVSNFGSYNETYGSLGAVVILLLWFWMSAMTILIGAEFNATLEQSPEEEKKPMPLQAASTPE